MTNNTLEKLRIFEQNVLRKIFGFMEDACLYRGRMNHESDQLIQGAEIREKSIYARWRT